MRVARSLPLLTVLSSAWLSIPVQGTRVTDEGSFTITIGGRTAGRENYRISAVARGTGTEFRAKADAAFGDRKVSPELRTDAAGAAIEYVVTRTGEGAEVWNGVIARGRLSARITNARGPSAREFIVPPGSAILDDDLFHQHYFIARRTHDGRVPVIVPHRNMQTVVKVSTVGTETLQVGTRELTATHLRFDESSGEHRDVWVDTEGRVLKVEIPARRLVAARDDPPRD
ncbi:MAG TPA: hypothetical protein VF981_01965 [Gemmatimonadaceae bacterium]|jgi:hypothetical protein